MAKTLLQGVNEVLKKCGIVSSSNQLSSLSDSGKQLYIDQAIQSINEVVRHLYLKCQMAQPNIVGTATLTLATGDRDYDLGITDMSRILWPIIDEDNDYFIWQYPGGWSALRQDKPLAADWQGRAEFAVIRPSDGQLLLDLTPTSAENGLTYTVSYEKDGIMSLAADTFPFEDSTFVDLVPAITEKFKEVRNSNPDYAVMRISLANAAKSLTQNYARTYW